MELKSKIRNSNIEMLRVLAMMFIFFHHVVYHGRTAYETGYMFNDYVSQLLFNGGKLGITIFTFIAGYYLIDSKFSWKRVLKFCVELIIFSLIFFSIYEIINKQPVDYFVIKKVLTPFLSETYWYVSCYILLYIFSPLLNAGLKNISKSIHLGIIIVYFLVLSLFPSFFNLGNNFSNLIWFIFLYVLAAFFKIYRLRLFINHNYINLLLAICLYMSISILTLFGNEISFFKTFPMNFTGMNATTMLLICIFLFNFFIQLKPKYSRIFNYLTCGTLEVYLIHENPYFREILYHKIMNLNTIPYDNFWSIKFVGLTIVSYFIILIIGSLINVSYNFITKRIDNWISSKKRPKNREEVQQI